MKERGIEQNQTNAKLKKNWTALHNSPPLFSGSGSTMKLSEVCTAMEYVSTKKVTNI
jgi:hypothetical protein